MNLKKKLFFSFLITLFFWSIFSWPLAKYLSTGIPCSAESNERHQVRFMLQGDHLQLMYHFWLFSSILKAETPFFYNIYEFNQGDDKDCYAPSFYYIPFSFIFSIISFFSTRAFGWNIVSFLSLWLTYLFTWILTRRYTENEITAIVLSLISILLPYRWITLLGGSPTGFGMLFVPMLILGIELAVKEENLKGGVLAGIALLFALFTDTHIFFFGVLIIPCWCFLSLIQRNNFPLKKIGVALLPLIISTLLSISLSFMIKSVLKGSTMATGRTYQEISLYSPYSKGFFSFNNLDFSSHIFVGINIILIIALGAFSLCFQILKNKEKNKIVQLIVFLSLILGIVVIFCLSLGTNGPYSAIAFRAIRKIVPPYAMIRQPTKIFCLVPTFLAVCGAISLSAFTAILKNKKIILGLLLCLAILFSLEYKSQVKASISLVADSQLAYEAVALDAQKEQLIPRVLVIPLWPGDSSWASLYEHYVSLYKMRMINGYSPVVKQNYFNDIFRQFETFNRGLFTAEQLDDLLKRKINYLIFHEDAFPEKVSPFPAGFTLKNLLNSQRLQLLKQDESIWSFKIFNKPKEKALKDLGPDLLLPTRIYDLEKYESKKAIILEDKTCSGGRFIRLTNDATSSTEPRSPHFFYVPTMSWLVRVRGVGELSAEITIKETAQTKQTREINYSNWEWISFPIPKFEGHERITLQLRATKGSIDVDIAMLSGENWLNILKEKKEIILPAALFFHAGYTNLQEKSVVFYPNKVHASDIKFNLESIKKLKGNQSAVLYGPKQPLPPGKYTVELNFTSTAPENTFLGSIHMRTGEDILCFEKIYAGKKTLVEFEVKNNLFAVLDFIYSGDGHIEIKEIIFSREKTPN